METNISTVQVVLMGLITVFVVLICLIVIIKILGLIMEKVAKKQPAPAVAPAAAAPSADCIRYAFNKPARRRHLPCRAV